MDKMILYVDHTSQLGGAEIWLFNQLQRFHKINLNVGVLFGDKGLIYDKAFAENIPTFYEIMPRINHIWQIVNSIKKIRKKIRDNNISIVYCNSFRSNVIVGIAAKLERKKVIWHMHESLERPPVSFFYYYAMKVLIHIIPDYVIANSKYTLDTLNVNKNYKIVYPSVNIDEFSNFKGKLKEDNFINITITGRIARWKGQHILIKAASIICKKRKDIRFIIAGAPIFNQEEYEVELKKMVDKLNLMEYVIFKGHVDDVPSLLNNTDIAVHCSIEPEPFGQVIIQAMAAGKPVIATAHGGPLEIINNGIDGILIEPNNPQVLADKIIELLDDKDFALRLGNNAKERAKLFSEEAQDSRVLEIYRYLNCI